MPCPYCGANDWFTYEDVTLCAECLSPETIDTGSYEDYIAKVGAEDAAKRRKFTTTERLPFEPSSSVPWDWWQDDEYGMADYYDKMTDERPRPSHPPFWKLLGQD